ncbi:MAG: succinylglutamate desuccinylase, partial [Candidatus Saccharicenans sp.]
MKNKLFRFKIVWGIIFAIFILAGGYPLYRHRHYSVQLICGPGVTEIKKLSDYFPPLKDTMADTT